MSQWRPAFSAGCPSVCLRGSHRAAAAVLRLLSAPAALCVLQERGEKWTPASEVQLCFEVKTFLLAGHETSSAMLCWTMYELSQNKAALEQVRSVLVPVHVPVCVYVCVCVLVRL